MDTTQFTIVIQGRVTAECYAFYLENYTKFNVVISTWDDNCPIDFQNCPFQVVVKSTFADVRVAGNQNLAYQVKSTASGLEHVKTPYCIKMRGDEYYSNLEHIMKAVVSSPDKLWVLPVFFRHTSYIKYHISDHLIAGTTANLKSMFGGVDDETTPPLYNPRIVPEVFLTTNYLNKRNPNYASHPIAELMSEYFDIVGLDLLKNYLVVWNGRRKKYYNSFVPRDNRSISSMADLSV